MQDAVLVEVVERLQHLLHDFLDVVLVYQLLLEVLHAELVLLARDDAIEQTAVLAVLDHVVVGVRRLPDLVQLENVRVLQVLDDLDLVVERALDRGGGGRLG